MAMQDELDAIVALLQRMRRELSLVSSDDSLRPAGVTTQPAESPPILDLGPGKEPKVEA